MTVGFSTGDFYPVFPNRIAGLSRKYIELYNCQGKAKALELHCARMDEVEFLLGPEAPDLSRFDYISLHAPKYDYKDDKDTNSVLDSFERLAERYEIDCVLFHADTVQDWKVLAKRTRLPVAVENMDERKDFGRTVDELRPILDEYDFGLVLDLQHCFVNDNSMAIAHEFHETYGDRIVEYHLSGYQPGDMLHYPLFKTSQDGIIEALRYPERPIIVESAFESFGDETREMNYIAERLKKHL